MMKYRILKKELCTDTWYEVQYRILWIWFTVASKYGTNKKFYDKELADKYICEQQPVKTTILQPKHYEHTNNI